MKKATVTRMLCRCLLVFHNQSDTSFRCSYSYVCSVYEGNKWDGFRDRMDEDLLMHLNGNAVYNVSHPCFRMMLEQMEADNSGTQAFDVAIRRIIRQFHPECEDAYMQTGAIENLAATLMLNDEANPEASYIHGAKMLRAVNDSITAIVSGFAGESSSTTLQGLLQGKHSFSDVIVVDDYGEPGASTDFTEVQLTEGASSKTIRIMNMTRYPGSSPARDFCVALEQVETPYFSFSNVFRVPTNLRPIMDDDGSIMVPCLPVSSSYCDDSCAREAAGAARFTTPPSPQPTEQWFFNEARRGLMDVPLMPAGGVDETCVVNGDAMIWASESARRYCSMLEEKLAKPSTDDCSQADATATSYLTYLQSVGEFEEEYQFYLKEQWGERSVFLPYRHIPECQDETELPQKDGIVVRRMDQPQHSLAKNESETCRLFMNETHCVAHGGCEWRGDFNGRCRLDVTYKVPSSVPTTVPTAPDYFDDDKYSYDLSCSDDCEGDCDKFEQGLCAQSCDDEARAIIEENCKQAWTFEPSPVPTIVPTSETTVVVTVLMYMHAT